MLEARWRVSWALRNRRGVVGDGREVVQRIAVTAHGERRGRRRADLLQRRALRLLHACRQLSGFAAQLTNRRRRAKVQLHLINRAWSLPLQRIA
eukprot:6214444-Pleurochrysis_carterae.AAC.2